MVISLRHAGWGRRTHRNGTRPAHDLQEMGRQACWRSDIAYLTRWRRATHAQRSWRCGNMQLGPRRSARKTAAQIVPNHETIEPTGKIPPPIIGLRHLLQIPCPAHSPLKVKFQTFGDSPRFSTPPRINPRRQELKTKLMNESRLPPGGA